MTKAASKRKMTLADAYNAVARLEKELEKAKELLKEAQGYIENEDDVLYDGIEQFLQGMEK